MALVNNWRKSKQEIDGSKHRVRRRLIEPTPKAIGLCVGVAGFPLAAVGFVVGCFVPSSLRQHAPPPEGNGSQGWQSNRRQWLARVAAANQRARRKDCGRRFRTFELSIRATPPESAFLRSPLGAVWFAGGPGGKPRMKKTMASRLGYTISQRCERMIDSVVRLQSRFSRSGIL